VVIGCEVDPRRRRVHDTREDGAGRGLVYPGHLLHRLRGERDLPAGDLATPGLGHEPVKGILDAIGVVERLRAEGGVERAVPRARPVHLEEGAGSGVNGVERQHWLLPVPERLNARQCWPTRSRIMGP
jgi:hypothetical protein